jgi:hypothetical protein
VSGNGIRFVRHRDILQGDDVAETAVEGAAEAGFVAVDEVQIRDGGERGEGGGGAHDFVAGRLFGEAGVEEFGLDAPDAARAPLGDGHFLDDGGLDGGGGGEAFEELVYEPAEELGVLIFEDDLGNGTHAVAEGVAGRDALAFGGYGTAGACAVGPRRFDASLRRHKNTRSHDSAGVFVNKRK